jgi:hypothetical protein
MPRGHALTLPDTEQLCADGAYQCPHWKADLEVQF